MMSGDTLNRLGLDAAPFEGAPPETAFLPSYLQRVERVLEPVLESRVPTLILTETDDAAAREVLPRVLDTLDRQRHLVARFDAWPDQPEPLLRHLLDAWGLESEEDSSVEELRALVELYIGHQAAKGRATHVVAPSEGQPPERVCHLLDWLTTLRHGGQFSVRLILHGAREITIPAYLKGMPTESSPARRTSVDTFPPLAPDEGRHYLHTRLELAGCSEPSALLDVELCRLAVAYASGRTGNLDRLLTGVLRAIARRDGEPAITQQDLETAATSLGLELVSETLTSDTSPQQALDIGEAVLRMSLEGEQASEVSLNQSRMVMGREQDCDICIESRFISRFQCLFMLTRRGWYVMDLGSTNGTYVNARRIREHLLRNGDLITIGRYQILFGQAGGSTRAGEEGDFMSTEVLQGRARSGNGDDSARIDRRSDATQ